MVKIFIPSAVLARNRDAISIAKRPKKAGLKPSWKLSVAPWKVLTIDPRSPAVQ
jgi:hypothetical protein